MTENKTLDLVVDQNVPYALLLQFTEEDGTLSNLTGYSLKGSIKKHLEDTAVITNFTTQITSADNGIAAISLSSAAVAALVSKADNKPLDNYDPRQRFVGYYDILLIGENKSFRIMQGRVIISLGVTA